MNSIGSFLISLFAYFCFMHWWVAIPINAFGGFCGCLCLGSGLVLLVLCFCCFGALFSLRGWIRISDRGMCISSPRKVYGFDYVPPLSLFRLIFLSLTFRTEPLSLIGHTRGKKTYYASNCQYLFLLRNAPAALPLSAST